LSEQQALVWSVQLATRPRRFFCKILLGPSPATNVDSKSSSVAVDKTASRTSHNLQVTKGGNLPTTSPKSPLMRGVGTTALSFHLLPSQNGPSSSTSSASFIERVSSWLFPQTVKKPIAPHPFLYNLLHSSTPFASLFTENAEENYPALVQSLTRSIGKLPPLLFLHQQATHRSITSVGGVYLPPIRTLNAETVIKMVESASSLKSSSNLQNIKQLLTDGFGDSDVLNRSFLKVLFYFYSKDSHLLHNRKVPIWKMTMTYQVHMDNPQHLLLANIHLLINSAGSGKSECSI